MKTVTLLPNGGATVVVDLTKPVENPPWDSWESWLKAIGGRNLGESQVELHHRGGTGSMDDGIIAQS